MVLSREFLAGYVVGEGSFNINKQVSSKSRYGNSLSARLSINCNRCDLPVLIQLREALGTGAIYNEFTNTKTVQFVVGSRKALIDIVIPYFEGQLYGGKLESFNKFKIALGLLEDGTHKTREGYEVLCSFIDTINSSGLNIRKDWRNQDERGTAVRT